MNLNDKICVVTGAGSGIGKALVLRFKEAGARRVVSVDLNAESAMETAGLVQDVSMAADVSVESDILDVIETTEADIGPIDLFCSNAGVGMGRDLSSPNNEWQISWDVNVMSHVYAARHLVPRMVDRGGGYFLNTASAAGVLNQIGSAAYGVTKHAAVGFGEWLAIHHKHQGIGVSMLCPQAVRTPMFQGSSTSTSAAAGVDGVLEPEEVADIVVRELEKETFMILPHPVVLDYMRNKTSNYDRWVSGMSKLMRKINEPG